MRHERQVELLKRVQASGKHLEGLHSDASRTNSTSSYSDPEQFAKEMKHLFRKGPIFFGLSADLAETGSYRALRVDGLPLVVVRKEDGSLDAFINACRHRGAPLVDTLSLIHI